MKYLIACCMIFVAVGLTAQEESDFPRNEIKINPLTLLFEEPVISITYERLLNEESSVGSSVLYVSNDGESGYGISPFYRLFFGKKPAAGFFVEAAGLLLGSSDSDGAIYGASIAIGTKVISKKNIVFDVFGGWGRWNENAFILGKGYPRFGLSIGKRF